MTTYDITQEVDLLRHVAPIVRDYGTPEPIIYSCTVFPAKEWDKEALETELRVTIPFELEQLWTEASRLELYRDETYGQWGIIIWPPDIVLTRQDAIRDRPPEYLLRGDLAIGEFRGDLEILLLRCDPSQPDFGAVIIVDSISGRDYWTTVADSLSMFLHKLRESEGKKY